jgi:hypothetical protein
MADSQVKDLTALTAPAMTDLVYVQADPSGTPVDRKVTVGNLRGCISSNTTLYVSPSGNDTTGDGSSGTPWRTVTKALDYLKDKWINTDVAVTISLADGNDGDHVYTSEIAPTHPCGSQITIKGANTHSKSMTSVQSSSGSAGAWAVVLNLDSVADIEANDYVMISGAANGTLPKYIMGIWKVTNVDAVNTRITVSTTHKNATAPSGAVTATVLVLKAVVNFNGCDGFVLRNGHHINLENLAIVGNGTANTVGVFASGDEAAIAYASCGGSVTCVAGTVGVSGFTYGYLAQFSGAIFADSSTSSGNTGYGYLAQYSGSIWASSSTSSGNTVDGYLAQYSGAIFASSSTASGNTGIGYLAQYSGSIWASSSTSSGNTIGYLAQFSGSINADSSTASGNTTGIYAASYGYINAVSATVSGNTTNYSPAVNTQGNEYGYIDS